MADITAIVNVYKRPHVLDEQIVAIRAQTIPPKAIFIWNNGNRTVDLTKYKEDPLFRVFDNTHNFGVWSRFLIGFLAPTPYICIFDDDTIPGNRWFENCVNSMKEKEALYGTIGVLFKHEDRYLHLKRYGWDGPRNISSYVDIVGHSWFFKREWLSYFTREEPQVYTKISNGEDIHFSYMLQKYANISTLVPPHPHGDQSLWGSIPNTAWKYGGDGNSETGNGLNPMFCEYIDRRFRIMIQRLNADSISDYNYFIRKIKSREPFALIRPADGEYYVLQNNTLTNIDKWTFTAGGSLSGDLMKAIQSAISKNIYIGIPCPTCNTSMAKWYVSHFNMNPLYTTFANVFVNNNWSSWVSFLKNEKIPFNLVGPENKSSDLCVKKFHAIPKFLVNEWDKLRSEYLDLITTIVKDVSGEIFFFAGGPTAKIFIAHSWAINPHNIYIDIGSSLDLYLKGETNRDYALGDSGLSTLVCKFENKLFNL
jgi:hypothetical protein